VGSTVDAASGRTEDRAGLRHEAFLYADLEEFLDVTTRFLTDAAAGGEPVLVVLAAEKGGELRTRLRGRSDHVRFADRSDLGENPARAMAVWESFLNRSPASGRRFRGIGELFEPGRSMATPAECQRHEALVNLAFGEWDFWLLCPYDQTALDPEVIVEARRTHQVVNEGGSTEASPTFAGCAALGEPCRDALSVPPDGASGLRFGEGDLPWVRGHVGDQAASAGMRLDRIDDLVLAANEIATNSLRHGGHHGTLLTWQESGSVVCEFRDDGLIEDPLVGRLRPPVDRAGRRGLWLANQLCDLVQVRALDEGNVVRLYVRT
jgi:anti-sigma regulatory factor (Ser/Thr protein kinase)